MLNKLVFYSLFTFFTTFTLSAQDLDLIVTNTGDSIACRIDSITNDQYYFEAQRNGSNLNTQIHGQYVSTHEMSSVDEQKIVRIPNSIYFTLVSASGELKAQYKINKEKYDFRDYKRGSESPYNPGLSAVSSFIIPGLGQVIAGETGRGLKFLAGDLASWSALPLGLVLAYASPIAIGSYFGLAMMIAGAGGVIGIPIWAAIDASRVAKVNSLAWQASKLTGFGLNLSPNFLQLPNLKYASGLTLSFKF